MHRSLWVQQICGTYKEPQRIDSNQAKLHNSFGHAENLRWMLHSVLRRLLLEKNAYWQMRVRHVATCHLSGEVTSHLYKNAKVATFTFNHSFCIKFVKFVLIPLFRLISLNFFQHCSIRFLLIFCFCSLPKFLWIVKW